MSTKNSSRLYMGLDLSTQQLKGVVINEELQTIAEEAINFNDQSLLVHHVQPNGFVVDKNDKRCITTPVFVFLEALDVLLQKLRDQKKFDFDQIVGISGCGQQHGSVYWKNRIGLDRLKNFHAMSNDPKASGETITASDVHDLPKNPFLVDLLKSSFSRVECPIWMDSSTTEQCHELERQLDGAQHLFELTGSKAYERFTGSQIMKIARQTPDIYAQTERIQLISNFIASVLLGDFAPIDLSDGSGMNLLDIREHKWSKTCLDVCGENLEKKLAEKLVYPRTALGTIAKYFVSRYGFNPECQIVSFTGDNPSSYYALASDPKTIVISLGTSDTVMASLPAAAAPKKAFDGHLLVNPLTANPDSDLLMLLLCFKNGSLVREHIREEVASKDWQQMSELLCNSPPSNHGFIGYFFDDHEILPQNVQGRYYFDAHGERVDNLEPACKARAVLEGQGIAKRLYLQRANVDLKNSVDRIVITGGASVNIDLLQMLADIFGKPVFAALAPNSGCLGGAYRAIDVVNNNSKSVTSTVQCLVAAQPRNEYTPLYDEMLVRYAEYEDRIIKDTKH